MIDLMLVQDNTGTHDARMSKQFLDDEGIDADWLTTPMPQIVQELTDPPQAQDTIYQLIRIISKKLPVVYLSTRGPYTPLSLSFCDKMYSSWINL